MIRLPTVAAPLAAATTILASCGSPAPAPSPTPTAADPASAQPAASQDPGESPATAGPGQADGGLAPPLVPAAEKGEKGARNVLQAWASALENQRFAEAYAQFGEGGPQNGMSAAEYAAQFGRCRKITVAAPSGTMEGAAGSLYYTAPTTLTCELVTGNAETWTGDVVLRRVNDVPGATPEQLRWHIQSAEVASAG